MCGDNNELGGVGALPSGRAVAASPSSPQAVSPVPASIPSAWRADAFVVTSQLGSHMIAGWVREPFALDFRVYDLAPLGCEPGYEDKREGWCLTHLPTGFQVVGILASLSSAFDIADEFRAAADWQFDDPADAKSRSAAVKPLMEKHSEALTRQHADYSPLFKGEDAQAIEARSGETRQGLDPKDESAVDVVDAPTPLGEISNHD